MIEHHEPTRWSRALNWLLAAVLLVLSLPAILLSALLVKLTSRGPVFYRQQRLGQAGRKFYILKIRTMVIDAEANSGPVWCRQNDPRITRVGRVLRALNWDELPQLINILRGDMAFVGPRPERPEIATDLVRAIPNYYDRLSVRPGLTGLAQVNLPADTSLDSVRQKLALDLEYASSQSAWLDLRLILATVPRLAGVKSRRLAQALGVYREPPAIGEVAEPLRLAPAERAAAAPEMVLARD